MLLVDSGDLHDGKLIWSITLSDMSKTTFLGAGLSDGFPTGDVDGHEVSGLHT